MATEHEIERMVVRLMGDNTSYLAAIAQATKATSTGVEELIRVATRLEGSLAPALQKVQQEVTNTAESFMGLGRSLVGFGGIITASVSAPILGLGYKAFGAATQMDSLKRGLTAVAGSSEGAEKQLVDLLEVAKLPGLGLPEAIQGSIRLQAAGFNAKLAERSLIGFGNALATVGKGRVDLEGVILALTQIVSKGKISAEEINQIAERVPQIRKVMQAAFGTSDSQTLQKSGISPEAFIEGIVRELEKMDRVTGGAQNTMENFSDTVFIGLSKVGEIILEVVGPAMGSMEVSIQGVVHWFESLTHAGKATTITLLAIVAAIGPLTVGLGVSILAVGNLITSFTTVVTAVKSTTTAIYAMITAQNLAKLSTLGMNIAYAALGAVLIYAAYQFYRVLTDASKWDDYLQKGRKAIQEYSQEVANGTREIENLSEVMGSGFSNKIYLEEQLAFAEKVLERNKKIAEMEKPGMLEYIIEPEIYAKHLEGIEKAEAAVAYFGERVKTLRAALDAQNAALIEGGNATAKTVAEADKYIAKLTEQVAVLRVGTEAYRVQQFEAAHLDEIRLAHIQTLTDELAQEKLLKKAKDETEQAQKRVRNELDSFIESMELAMFTMGKEGDEARLLKLEFEGLTQAELKEARSLAVAKKAAEEHEKAIQSGKKLIEQYLTPQEKWLKRQGELANLLKVNAIDQKTYNRAIQELTKDLMEAEGHAKINVRFTMEGNDAVRKGTAEFFNLLSEVENRTRKPIPFSTPNPAALAAASLGGIPGAAPLAGYTPAINSAALASSLRSSVYLDGGGQMLNPPFSFLANNPMSLGGVSPAGPATSQAIAAGNMPTPISNNLTDENVEDILLALKGIETKIGEGNDQAGESLRAQEMIRESLTSDTPKL